MRYLGIHKRAGLGAAFALLLAGPAHAGYESLSSSGSTVLKTCNPNDSSSASACKVSSLPGESGYNLVASRSAPIIINGVTVGTQYEKAWRHCTDTKQYIFGIRVEMNAEAWDDSGAAFNVNDLIRQTRRDQSVKIAYNAGSPAALKALRYAGRTANGLNEYEEAQPERNNAWVAYRIDANAAEASGTSSPQSPWLLLKTKAPEGYSVKDFALRLLNSENEDADQNSILAAGYQPNCTSEECAPEDDDD